MYLVRPPYFYRKLYKNAVWRMDEKEKSIYLTFDDGPIPEVTTEILNILKQENVPATFFCVGDNIRKHPEIFNEIKAAGHAIGNHTFNHLKGWNTHTFRYIKNIEMCDDLIHSQLFRPPYGKIKKTQNKILSSKYKMIMWDVLSGDYDKNTSPEKCLKNVIEFTRNGSIIVFHDNIKAKKNVLFALPEFIKRAKRDGYTFKKLN